MNLPDLNQLESEVSALLEGNWDAERGYCVPNHAVYPHLWLWDSCFHALVWAELGDHRGLLEVQAVLEGQLPGGMVPHMRYGPAGPDTWLGPLTQTSSLTQPPMFGHVLRVLAERGQQAPAQTLDRARRGLDWLWQHRRTDDGLIYIVHPWEAGNDHSPRWDDWGAPGRTPEAYSRPARTEWNKARVHDMSFADDGAGAWSSSFVTCPVNMNAYTAFNLSELAHLTGDAQLARRATDLAAAIDTLMWDPEEQLWSDRAVVGGGESVRIPTSDGLLGALVTTDARKAGASLSQLTDPARFGAPYGPTNVARTHPSYDPHTYWRGPAWPPLSYLFVLALQRWERHEQAGEIARAATAAAQSNGWAEYWNPETGEGLGAAPQSWASLAMLMQTRTRKSTS